MNFTFKGKLKCNNEFHLVRLSGPHARTKAGNLLLPGPSVTGAGLCIRDTDIDSDLLFSMNFGGYHIRYCILDTGYSQAGFRFLACACGAVPVGKSFRDFPARMFEFSRRRGNIAPQAKIFQNSVT